jgi:hypothetical protein
VSFFVALLLAFATTSSAQSPPSPDGIASFLSRVETLLEAHDADGLLSLINVTVAPEQAAEFARDLARPDIQRASVRERDRVPLDDALPGDGYRLVVELFLETAGRARIVTALMDVRRVEADRWMIVGAQGLTTVEGLFRLRVNATRQMAARNLTITAEDLRLTLPDGTAFFVEGEDGITGLILFGRGEMRFSPAPETEKGQLRIFAGSDVLNAAFDSVFIRLSPYDYAQRVTTASLSPVPVNPRLLRRAQEVFARDSPKSYSLDLDDVSREIWYLLPTPGDFLAEVRTRKYGTLTYTRAAVQTEDITVFDRDRRRTIALYPSALRVATRGRSFNEDDLRDYDVLDYNVEATVSPERQFIDGRVRMRLRVRGPQLSSLTLRLADPLAVSSIISPEYGRLLHLRVRNQNSVIVNLPVTLVRDTDFTLVVNYSGRLESQDVDAEGLRLPARQSQEESPLVIPAEPNFLLSNRSYWYPQNPITDYATATLRITVPTGYSCVASGDPRPDNDVTLRDLLTVPFEGKSYVFRAAEPLRYLAVVISRFVRVGEATVTLPPGGTRESLRIAVDANPRQQSRGRSLLNDVDEIVRFYSGVIGDAPYASTTVALVEDQLPGGHSPGYFAVLNNPLPYSPYTWRNDPASFQGFPEFFIAHELAHQWWGQAVGWRNYHEQWISEGFAQYFAALYARQSRGDSVFADMLRQFRRWAIAESDEGPISLGYRLGHIKGDTRIFRALIYNKGAAVLHMLRRTVGDDVFFRALRRFYTEQRFQKAGTEDLRHSFEAESGKPLDRFFERWIYGSEVPRLRYTTTIGPGYVTARFDQGGEIFDVPVTVTILYTDGRSQDVIVQVDDSRVEQRIPTSGLVRQVQVNRDFAAVAQFEQAYRTGS